jgi:hypothetical protein
MSKEGNLEKRGNQSLHRIFVRLSLLYAIIMTITCLCDGVYDDVYGVIGGPPLRQWKKRHFLVRDKQMYVVFHHSIAARLPLLTALLQLATQLLLMNTRLAY